MVKLDLLYIVFLKVTDLLLMLREDLLYLLSAHVLNSDLGAGDRGTELKG